MGWSKRLKGDWGLGQMHRARMFPCLQVKNTNNKQMLFHISFIFLLYNFAGRGCRTTPSTLSTTLRAAIQKAQSCWQKLGKRMNVPTVERSSSTTTAWRSTLKACTKLQRFLVTSVESCWKVRRHWPATWRVFMRRRCDIIALNQGVPWPQWTRTI